MTVASPQEGRARVRLALVVTSGQDVVPRIVRVASSGPFELIRLRVDAPRAGRRRLHMVVEAGTTELETLRRRLDRVIDVLAVRVVTGPPAVGAAPPP